MKKVYTAYICIQIKVCSIYIDQSMLAELGEIKVEDILVQDKIQPSPDVFFSYEKAIEEKTTICTG